MTLKEWAVVLFTVMVVVPILRRALHAIPSLYGEWQADRDHRLLLRERERLGRPLTREEVRRLFEKRKKC